MVTYPIDQGMTATSSVRADREAEDEPTREAVLAYLERVRLQQVQSPERDLGPVGRRGPSGRNSRRRYR
jgi:hypothetical protein